MSQLYGRSVGARIRSPIGYASGYQNSYSDAEITDLKTGSSETAKAPTPPMSAPGGLARRFWGNASANWNARNVIERPIKA